MKSHLGMSIWRQQDMAQVREVERKPGEKIFGGKGVIGLRPFRKMQSNSGTSGLNPEQSLAKATEAALLLSQMLKRKTEN